MRLIRPHRLRWAAGLAIACAAAWGGRVATLGDSGEAPGDPSAASGGAVRGKGAGAVPPPYAPFVPGELIVRFRPAPAADHAGAAAAVGGRRVRSFLSGAEHWVLAPGGTAEEAIDRLRKDPRVLYAEPNYIVRAGAAPNDPRYSQLWGLHNTGQSGGILGADISAEGAWTITTGSRQVLVGVIDSGVDYTHPDLSANIWTNPGEIPANGIDDDGNGFVDDVHGWDFVNEDNDPMDDNSHGTHVAGTIGAVGNNGVGVAGVNWSVSIVPLKFLGSSGQGSTADAIQAIDYATRMGVKITNNSWGGASFSQALLDAIRAGNDAGMLFVAAAGNDSSDNDLAAQFPASYDSPNIVSVAATDRADLLAHFSNFGALTVDLAAPGVDIVSTVPGGGYGTLSGTSMASPHVTGAAALVRALHPGITPAKLREALIASVDPVAALHSRTLSGGRLNAQRLLESQDETPPSAIGDLAVVEPTSNTIIVQWTAVGDDGATGTAFSYDVRYSASPIDETNFAAASSATGVPTPSPAGSAETMEVTGLAASTSYYVAVRALDDYGNEGPISNVVTATTLQSPTLSATPPSFSVTLTTGEAAERTLTIANAGAGTLDWKVPLPFVALPPATATTGVPAIESAGGPDPFGYRFIDSDEPGSPPFTWTDISVTGTPVGSLTGDDQISGLIPLGFEFPFYGDRFTSVRVGSNGFLTFTSKLAASLNFPLPSAAAPENLIAPFWTDLDFQGASRAAYVTDGDVFTVQYTDVPRFSGPGTYTFQVALGRRGDIVFRYLTMGGALADSSIGIQDSTRARGLQVAFRAPYVHDGLAVRLAPVSQWLSASPSSGRLRSGESAEVRIGFDAAGFAGGIYEGTVFVETNDPAAPREPHDVRMVVRGAAGIDVQPASIDFGVLFAGFAAARTLVVTNTGSDTLDVTGIDSSDPEVTLAPTSFTLAAGARQAIVATWAPASPRALAATATITSTALNAPLLEVPLAGAAEPAPTVQVSPSSVAASLFAGQQGTESLRVTNNGSADVVLDATADLGGATPLSASAGVIGSLPPAVSNGGFESGTFQGWTAGVSSGTELIPWSIAGGGSGYFFNSSPVEGTLDALNGFDGSAGLVYTLSQDIALPTGLLAAELSWWDRIQYDSLGTPSLLPRVYEARLLDAGGGLLTTIVHLEISLNGRGYTDLGWQRRRVDLLPYAGRTVRLEIREEIAESFTGPATIEFDGFEIAATVLPDWLGVQPIRRTIPPGEFRDFTVKFNATGAAAAYLGAVVLTPGTGPAFVVPASLRVLPAPKLVLAGPPITRQSAQGYGSTGAMTSHRFGVASPPAGSAVLEIDADGDYGSFAETATVLLEGRVLGSAGGAGTDCSVAHQAFDVPADVIADAAADGVVDVVVQNSSFVELFCPTNEHRVSFTWRPPITSLDFGSVIAGASKTLSIRLENTGTAVLDVTSIGAADPSVTAGLGSASLAPGTSRIVPVTFAPATASGLTTSLVIESNDPGAPAIVLPVTGTGADAPVLRIEPAAISAIVDEGGAAQRSFTLTNDGAGPLEVALVAAAGSGAGATAAPPAAPAAAAPALTPATALVSEWFSGEISIVDTSTGMVTAIASGLSTPNKGLVLSPDARTAYVTESLAGTVAEVDVATGAITEIATGLTFPNGLALDPTGSTLYVGETGRNRILKLDLATRRLNVLSSSIDVPNGIALDPVARKIYAGAVGSQKIVSVDLATGAVTTIASSLHGPVALALDAARGAIYFVEIDTSELRRLDLATKTISLVASGVFDPEGIALGPGGGTAYVTSFSNGELLSVDLATGTIGRVGSGLGGPTGVVFPPGPLYVRLGATAATIPPSSSLEVAVEFDSTGLPAGAYGAGVLVSSNDPLRPSASIPLTLLVVGRPDLRVWGREADEVSSIDFSGVSAVTVHRLAASLAAAGLGRIELEATGGFGGQNASATVSLEGTFLGTVGPSAQTCASVSGSFPIDASLLQAAAADGVFELTVQNSGTVGQTCSVNNHTLRLTYRAPADPLDFGTPFAGVPATEKLLIENAGSEPLHVLSLGTSAPEFAVDPPSVTIPPRGRAEIQVRFLSSALGPHTASLAIASDDPDTPLAEVSLLATAIEAPVMDVQPRAVDASIAGDGVTTLPITVTNTGGSPLTFATEVIVPGQGPRPGEFQSLATSPFGLGCVVEDPGGPYLYGQAFGGAFFQRYVARDDVWETLAPAPFQAPDNCGAALLGGKIYTAFASGTLLLGVYDIATDTWSTLPTPLGTATADIATDGDRWLYLVGGASFVRYDPASGTVDALPAPPFAFTAWGGMRWLDGVLYAHQGDGTTGFASYDVGAGAWTVLPPVPGGAVTGAAIDPGARAYVTYGSHGGLNLYRYFVDAGTWSVEPIPGFRIDDGGLGWLPEPVPGIYFAQGQAGTRLARAVTGPSFLSVHPASATVPAGGSLDLQARFDAAAAAAGEHDAVIRISGNDPATPSLEIPARLTVTGLPRISVEGQIVALESSRFFGVPGAVSTHLFSAPVRPGDGGSLEVTAFGDFGDPRETATATAEGILLGKLGGSPPDCSAKGALFPLDAATLGSLTSDGAVTVEVRNSFDVEPLCPENRHTVRLRYRGSASHLDYGSIYTGDTRRLSILIRNRGSAPLDAGPFTADRSEFVASPETVRLAPGQAIPIEIEFRPLSPGLSSATLSIPSTDPVAPLFQVSLTGRADAPPALRVDPPSLSAVVQEQESAQASLTIANAGGSDLIFTASAKPAGGGAAAGAFQRRSPSPGPITCIIEDPGRGLIYAQGKGIAALYRYTAAADTWETLAPPPDPPSTDCGAAILGGKIYSAHADDTSRLHVYDIAGDAWSSVGIGIPMATADIASDGDRWLYLAWGSELIRFDPATATRSFLAPAPFEFTPRGALRWFAGFLYGHAGGSRNDFAAYDVAADRWQRLASIPSGVVMGAAFDPTTREFIVHGDTGAPEIYSFAIDTGVWSTATNPFFGSEDGGLCWLAAPSPALYVPEGGSGVDLASRSGGAPFVSVHPASGRVPPGGSTALSVLFEAGSLPAGDYRAEIAIESNDPSAPAAAVPVTLGIIRLPDIAIAGEPVSLSSSSGFGGAGASTEHHLPIDVPPSGDGTIDLVAEGDFGSAVERATLLVEGQETGAVNGDTGTCGRFSSSFAISSADLQAAAADGAVDLRIVNDVDVDSSCPISRHTVTLRYRGSSERLDFGDVLLGQARTRSIAIENHGRAPLHVTALAIAGAGFSTAATTMTIDPLGSAAVAVELAPAAEGASEGLLSIVSDDPDTPRVDVHLVGAGRIPPVAGVAPSLVEAAAAPGSTSPIVKRLSVTNTGGSPLSWSASILPALRSASARSVLAIGGPDPSGYFFRDSDAPGGPGFDWIDVSAIGSPVAVTGNNATSAPIPIGFDFPFYGNTFSTLRVCTNGFLSFTSPRVSAANPATLPTGGNLLPENLLAPFWDDLDFGAVQRATAWGDQGRFIVQFSSVPRSGGAGSLTFEVILYPSGRILFQYLSMSGLTDSATIGIQNFDRTVGLLVAANRPYVHDGLAIAFDRAPSWLKAAPASGTVAAGGTETIEVEIDPTGLAAGDQQALIGIATSDPSHPQIEVPVVLHVAEVALDAAEIRPRSLVLGGGGSVRVALQLPPAYDPRAIVVESVTAGGTVHANGAPPAFEDTNGDGVEEIVLRFDRSALAAVLRDGADVPVVFTGEVRDTVWFRGTAMVRSVRTQSIRTAPGGRLSKPKGIPRGRPIQ